MWPRIVAGIFIPRRKPLFSSFGEHTAVCGSSVRQAVARPRHRQSVCIHNIHVALVCSGPPQCAATCGWTKWPVCLGPYSPICFVWFNWHCTSHLLWCLLPIPYLVIRRVLQAEVCAGFRHRTLVEGLKEGPQVMRTLGTLQFWANVEHPAKTVSRKLWNDPTKESFMKKVLILNAKKLDKKISSKMNFRTRCRPSKKWLCIPDVVL